MSDRSLIVPPPWDLQGKGFMFFFWGPKRIDAYSGISTGGIGAMMVVQYENSPVGPYNELLFIPGKQHIGKRSGYFISKIYVDSQASTVSGRENWGIPKEMATLDIVQQDSKRTTLSGIRNGKTFVEMSFQTKGFSFPVSTSILPIQLVQHFQRKNYLTKFLGKGKAQWSSLEISHCDESLFPDIRAFTLLGGVGVTPFQLTFPVPSTFLG